MVRSSDHGHAGRLLSADGTQWTSLDGKTWTLYGSWAFTKGPTNFASIHIAQPTSVIATAVRDATARSTVR
jgi:hypothetical protein